MDNNYVGSLAYVRNGCPSNAKVHTISHTSRYTDQIGEFASPMGSPCCCGHVGMGFVE